MAEMKLEVPPDIVRSIVQAQVVAALGQQDKLIEGVVAAALSEKNRDRYSSSTDPSIFQEQVSRMIREVAVEAFKEWLAENREKIRTEMRRQLTAQKGKALGSIIESIMAKLADLTPSVHLYFSDK